MTARKPSKGDRVAEYILEERLGAGGFGEVWKAVHAFLPEEVVAVKIPTDLEFIDNLRREGALLHALQGEHIVAIKGLDPYGDPPYLTMEYVAGKSLRQVLEEMKSLPLDEAVEIYRQALEGLRTAHRQGVIHRDIKPENIMIDPDGVVKLTDFGLGRAVEATASVALQSGALRSVGERGVTGTLRYMSPEQREGAPVDARTDLYSLGIVLFEMLVGETPQGAELPTDLKKDLPPWVDKVFSRCYTRLERRYANAAEALEHLATVLPRPRTTDIVYLSEVKETRPAPPVAILEDPLDDAPKPLWMVPFFGVHAVFEGLDRSLTKMVRGIRDGGAATGLSVLFIALLAAGAVVLLANRALRLKKERWPAPVASQRSGIGGLDEAYQELRSAYAREDWNVVWKRLASRAREQIAEGEGWDPMDARQDWRRQGAGILGQIMKEKNYKKDPPGVLATLRESLGARRIHFNQISDTEVRIDASGHILHWIWDPTGGWKLNVPPPDERRRGQIQKSVFQGR